MAHHSYPSRSPAQAKVALGSDPFARRKTGFFPRAPGPNLIVFALIVGVVPSVFATFYVLMTGLDGGYYMPPDFIEDQRRALASLCLIVCLAAAIALVFLLNALRSETGSKASHIGLACVVLCVIAWDLFFFLGLRSTITPPLGYGDIEAATGPSRAGPVSYMLERDVFWAELAVEDVSIFDDLTRNRAGPVLCTALGSVFRGPVNSIGLRGRDDAEALAEVEISREACRSWYLRDRRPANVPAPRPIFGPGHMDTLFGPQSVK